VLCAKWHRQEGMSLEHISTAISDAQAMACYSKYHNRIHEADVAAKKARSTASSEAKASAASAAKEQMAVACSA
jgi:hypothetical protein